MMGHHNHLQTSFDAGSELEMQSAEGCEICLIPITHHFL
jgi:hypothetical protein